MLNLIKILNIKNTPKTTKMFLKGLRVNVINIETLCT